MPGKLRKYGWHCGLNTIFQNRDSAQYRDRVSFLKCTYGIEAASRLYFGKSAEASSRESVFLAGLVQTPSRFNPYRNLSQAIQRQQALLGRMYEQHVLDETQYELARQEEIRLVSQQIILKLRISCNDF